MGDSLYARARVIAHHALELPTDRRPDFLDARCGEEAALRREVDWLIAAADDDALDDVPRAIVDAASTLIADQRVAVSAPGSYRLIECLGDGGMGVVWLAEREVGGARQRVALKRLRAGSVTGHARFQEEQRILAALNHPNIAHLVDAGTDADGKPFLAMEYVDGERIDQWCATRALDLRGRAELFLKVCAAVSYAHERLIIHRDIKPANILVDTTGEPKLLDFGIARLIDTDHATRTATRLMTPAYASPEQIAGKPLGTATDVWSLGVTLYELLAGVHPFAHLDTDHARAEAILSARITPPSQQSRRGDRRRSLPAPGQRPRIPADVDAIVQKALRHAPEQRYTSVRELADDIRNFLAARPVIARHGQRAYRVQRFVQRQRWPLAVGTLVIALTVGFTWRTVLAEREARLQAQVAERTTEFLISAFALADPNQSDRHDFSAREVLDRSRARVELELADQPRARARLLEALGNAYHGVNEGSTGAALLEAAAQLYLDPVVDDPLAAARSLRAKSAAIATAMGSTNEIERAARHAFALVRRHAHDDHAELAESYSTLARALSAGGKSAAAIEAADMALALREADASTPQVMAQALLDVCFVHGNAGTYDIALDYCERGRSTYIAAGLDQSSSYRVALRQLEYVLSYSGEYARALAVARDRLALTRTLFGEDSAALAREQVNIADPLAESGLFDEAEASLAAAIPAILRHHGPDSTEYAQAVFASGWVAFLLGDHDRAVPQLREARAIHEALVDSHDVSRRHVLRTALATALVESGDSGEEPRALLESVIDHRRAEGAEAHYLAYARLPLAQWHVMHGEHETAGALLDLVDTAGSRVEAELHARAAATRASILQARGDARGALQQAQLGYDLILRDRGVDNPRTARYALALARALHRAGEHARAEAMAAEYRPRLAAAYPATSAHRQLLSMPP